MHLEQYGSGNKVYCGLHGWGGDHRTFASLLPYLPPGATFYSADLPGYGRSPAPRDWAAEAVTEEIVAALARLDAAQFTLVGNCSGAVLGLLAALRLGPRVERVVLLDMFAYLPWYFRVFVEPSFGRYAYNATFANPVGRWLTNLSLRHKRATQTDLTGSFAEVNHEVAYQQLALLGRIAAQGLDQFQALRMPLDVLHGERTFAAVKQLIPQVQRLWPQARVWPLAGVGHLPLEEAPAQVSRILFAATHQQEAAA
jgi:pimeloyl-ACP methyl ester carboxylesterase